MLSFLRLGCLKETANFSTQISFTHHITVILNRLKTQNNAILLFIYYLEGYFSTKKTNFIWVVSNM